MSICKRSGILFRWKASALFCLQEAAMDWMIDFFFDYILAAHAHRVTVMNKYFFSLVALCFRYDKLLRPVAINDAQMVQILDVHLVQKVRIEEVMEEVPAHEHMTQANFQASTQRGHCLAMLSLQIKRENVCTLHAMN